MGGAADVTATARSAPALRWIEPAGQRLPPAKALPLLRAAVEAAPDHLESRLRLSRALLQADRLAELVEWLAPLAHDEAAPPELLHDLGRAAAAEGDVRLALVALERAAATGLAPALGELADVLLRLGRPEEALAAGLRAIDATPTHFKPFTVVAKVLIARGERSRLWDLCAELRGRGAWAAYVPSAMAHAAMSADQRAEVARLVGRDRWSCLRDLVPGSGLVPGGGDGFNDALRDELLAHSSMAGLSSIKATIGAGGRVGQLHLQAGPRAQALLAGIRAAVDAYVVERSTDGDHPMIAHRPEAVSLRCWAVAVRHDGHESWHLHPSGWISGVYYAAVPEQPTGDGRAGTIELGPMPFGTDAELPAWPRSRVAPRPGQLLLFPSYYGHRTWPTGRDEPRLCVAFDVVPVAAEAG